MRALGAALLLLAAGGVGLLLAARRRARVELLTELEGLFYRMEDELRQRGTPLPGLLQGEGGRCPLAGEALFAAARAAARGKTAEQALAPLMALAAESCGAPAAALVREAAVRLGKYDGETQALSCRRTAERLGLLREREERLLAEKSRVEWALSLSAGAVAALMIW